MLDFSTLTLFRWRDYYGLKPPHMCFSAEILEEYEKLFGGPTTIECDPWGKTTAEVTIIEHHGKWGVVGEKLFDVYMDIYNCQYAAGILDTLILFWEKGVIEALDTFDDELYE